jgi:hypothetical protein
MSEPFKLAKDYFSRPKPPLPKCKHEFDDVNPEPGKPWLGTCKCGAKVKLLAVPCE